MLLAQDIKKYVEENPTLVRVKTDPRTGLRVLKYHNRVFYRNLWTPMLQKMRGMVVDSNYRPIIRPFDKVFNYKENGTYLSPVEKVIVVRKVNGFMAAARYVAPWGLLVSTTGTMDSEFSELARKHIAKFTDEIARFPNLTFIFEIVDPSDPHIVVEDEGAYLIGVRDMDDHYLLSPSELYRYATREEYFANIGDHLINPMTTTFAEVLKWNKKVQHEGWMVYGSKVLKLKSAFYLTTKLLGRMSPEKLSGYLLAGKKIPWMDEDYQWVLDRLQKEIDYFLDLPMPDRVSYVRSIIMEGM